MKLIKTLRYSALGICCSLGLSSPALTQDSLISATIDRNNNVNISVAGDYEVSINITEGNPLTSGLPSTEILYDILVRDDNRDVVDRATGRLVDSSLDQQINNLTITTGRGNDDIFINVDTRDAFRTVINGDITIDSRNGNDSVAIRDVISGGRIIIRTRGGRDEVFVNDVNARTAFIGLGSGGSDRLQLRDSTFLGRAAFSGGNGRGDTFVEERNTFLRNPVFRRFE